MFIQSCRNDGFLCGMSRAALSPSLAGSVKYDAESAIEFQILRQSRKLN